MIKQNVTLKDYSHYRIGGPARYFLEVSSLEELISGLKEWKQLSDSLEPDARKIFNLGSGTNLVIDDRGYNGLIIKNYIKLIDRINDNTVLFGAGLLFQDALTYCIDNSLSGFEWGGGLPGTIGGAIRGNAGAFGGEVKDNLFEVKYLDVVSLTINKYNNNQCRFSYRSSIFKTDEGKDKIIVSGTFTFQKGDNGEIAQAAYEKIAHRESRQPLDLPNCGSTFKNVDFNKIPDQFKKELEGHIKNDPFPVIPAATLLSKANLKGKRVGDAMISEKHPNFIVNLGNATANDVLSLIKIAKEEVKQQYEIELEPEIMFLNY